MSSEPAKDESEFTDFGARTPGTLDLRVFDQARWWVDVHAVPHLIVEMSLEYRRNVLAWIEDNRDLYAAGVLQRRVIELLFGLQITPIAGEGPGEFPADSAAWLNATALHACLVASLE